MNVLIIGGVVILVLAMGFLLGVIASACVFPGVVEDIHDERGSVRSGKRRFRVEEIDG